MYIRPTYVTATEYGVSTTTGTDIEGVILDVYRSVPCERTATYHFTMRTEFAVKGMKFATHEEADNYAFAMGWLKLYVPKSK